MDASTSLRRAALAIAGGLALYAAHPPLGLGWLGLVAVAPLAALARSLHGSPRPLRAALGWGTAAGLVLFGPLLTWILNTGELAAWLFLVPAQALFVGVFLAVLVAWGQRPWRPAVVVVAWVAVEALRSAAPLGGFPWGVLGYSQAEGGPLLGVARSLGVLGVSAACAAVAAAAEELVHRARAVSRSRPPQHRVAGVAEAVRTPLAAGLAVLVAGVLLGGEAPAPSGASVDVLGIQGYDAEGSTGRSALRSARVAESMRAVTAEALDGDRPDLVVWAENAFDGDPRSSEELAGILDDTLELLAGVPLLTGVIEDGPRPATHHNSMLLFEGGPAPSARYVKRRLVPFGEYVPARHLLAWFPPLDRVPSDGIPGTEPTVVDVAGARVGVGICFDVVFPRFAREQVRGGADVLVVATNNISYGRSAMSDQHIAFSQLRAVETGRWVVHVALSGRSALVDPDGRVHQRTGQYEQAVVRADVPLVEGTTLATRVGGAVGAAAMVLVALGLLWVALDRRRVAPGAPGEAARMSASQQPPTDPHARGEVAEELDSRDPVDAIADGERDDERERDQAWEQSSAMEGPQPSS